MQGTCKKPMTPDSRRAPIAFFHSCGRAYRLKPATQRALAGKKVRCKGCQQRFTIPPSFKKSAAIDFGDSCGSESGLAGVHRQVKGTQIPHNGGFDWRGFTAFYATFAVGLPLLGLGIHGTLIVADLLRGI